MTRLDFSLLSMTELRTGPGEILDRVAKGEAFIIERSGQRKACLVPLTAFFPDVSPGRIAEELRELDQEGEQTRTTITEKRELAFRFSHRMSDGSAQELMIVLPHGYPNRCPRIYAPSLDGDAPHRWADGALCIFGVMSVWNPGKHTVTTSLSLARTWLNHYNAWRQTGRWPALESTNG